MNIKDKITQINQRWGILRQESPKEVFDKFKTRIFNVLKDIDRLVSEEGIGTFCQVYGIPEKWESDNLGMNRWSRNIINRLVNESNEIEFYKLLEIIFALPIRGSSGGHGRGYIDKGSLYRDICNAIDLSDVNLATSKAEDGEVIFYPKGEEALDRELVDNVFSFLNKASGDHFKNALGFYQSKNPIKSAESLRRSLEEFLHDKMKNTVVLAKNISALKDELKKDGVEPQVKNIILQACFYLEQYFNENSKHHDGDIDEAENEFLVYQTGVLMRYLNKVL